MDRVRLLTAIQATFAVRATHSLPITVPPPPSNWGRLFQQSAREVGLGLLSIESGFHLLQVFLNPVLENGNAGTWDPSAGTWR